MPVSGRWWLWAAIAINLGVALWTWLRPREQPDSCDAYCHAALQQAVDEALSPLQPGRSAKPPKPWCRGRAEVYYGTDGEPVRIERDCDGDGKIDVVEKL